VFLRTDAGGLVANRDIGNRWPIEIGLAKAILAAYLCAIDFGRTIGPFRLRCRLGARSDSLPNIDKTGFQVAHWRGLRLKCTYAQ
jgi:hypothetical protein